MNFTCDIIQDLMPSYIDGICSESSKNLIEKHIKECEVCAMKLKALSEPVEEKTYDAALISSNPLRKIKKRHRTTIILCILSTALIIIISMFAIQNIGVLHDFFFPKKMVTIQESADLSSWTPLSIDGSKYLNMDSLFYNKEVVNHANSGSSVRMRIYDESGETLIKELIITPGKSASLDFLNRNQNYLIQIQNVPEISFLVFRACQVFCVSFKKKF